MHAWELMTPTAMNCLPTTSCAVIAQVMRRRRSGFVVIVDGVKTRQVVGVVTARDIVRLLVRLDEPASRIAVSRCMTRAPATIPSGADLKLAVQVMKETAVSRLPVLDAGKLVGVLALSDMALASRQQWAYVGAQVSEEHITDVVAAIASARGVAQARGRR